MTSPTYEPRSRSGEPGLEQPGMPSQDPGYGDNGDQSNSTVDTAKGEAVNVKDTAAGAAWQLSWSW